LNIRLAFAIAAAAFGSAFQHGYNTGVLNAPQRLITDWIRECNVTTSSVNGTDVTVSDAGHEECLTDTTVIIIWSWIVAAFCVGGMIGGSAVGVVSSNLGRSDFLHF
jgi:SP family facilitated glucose transporter-like MFS transporter 1